MSKAQRPAADVEPTAQLGAEASLDGKSVSKVEGEPVLLLGSIP